MKKRFEKRIRTYVIVSMLLLVLFNSLSVNHLLKVIDGYIESNGEYAAIELKDTYEKAYELETYYLSNSSEYNRYFLEQWYDIIESLYEEVEKDAFLREEFFTYLEEVESSTNLTISIYDEALLSTVYPNDIEGKAFNMVPLIRAEVFEDLRLGENVLFEDQRDSVLKTTKIMKMETGEHLMMTLKGDYVFNGFSMNSVSNHIKSAFEKNDRYMSYYVVNDANEVLFSSEIGLEKLVLDAKDKDKTSLVAYLGGSFRTVYRDIFYVNQKIYLDSAFHLLPLVDGNCLILITDESSHTSTINRITFIAILITFVGVVVIYFLGTVMIFLVEKYNLTAHRVANSNQINRMIIVIFAVLMLLNGMSIVQINKVVFTKEYEKAALKSLKDYAHLVENSENQFKRFVNMTRQDALIQSAFIYKGMKLLGGDLYLPHYSLREVTSMGDIEFIDRDFVKCIEEKGYFEYYEGPKLFLKDDFDTFYENYVLEQLPGESLHAIYRIMVYPSIDNEGYVFLKKDIGKQMDILYGLRKEFKELCKPDENELFVSNITVYNDTGITVISNDYNEKFASRKLKDELTGYPLWYWYQFKHNELFRTVVKSIDGTYKEDYSLVYYHDGYEYYFVYSVPRKVIFKEMEQLYNLYVSAMMFLLVSVFLTLGIRIRIKRKE